MHRIGLLLGYGLNYFLDKLKPHPPQSLNKQFELAKHVTIICPPGATVLQCEKQVGDIISLFSSKIIQIIHYNPELSEGSNLFDPPLPSINLASLAFWEGLKTPALSNLNGIKCDLVINLDPEERFIYRYITKRLQPAFTAAIAPKNDTRNASFLFTMFSDELDKSLENFCKFLKSIGTSN